MYNILRVRRDRKYADLLRFCPYPAVFTYDVFVSSPCISVVFTPETFGFQMNLTEITAGRAFAAA